MKTLATALGAAVAALALVLPAAPAQAATYRYDITLAADTLGPGGVFGITALPAPAAHGHVSFDADPQAQDLSYANVVDFVLQVGQQSFTLEDLAAALFDFQPGQVGGPLTGAFFIGSTADRAFFHLDTMNGWYAGADVLAGGCDFGVADAADRKSVV
jgi:hypothetical protein